jgi:hypothetical protein
MSTSKKIQDVLRARRHEAAELEEAAKEAAKLEDEIKSLRREVVPLEDRKARLTALGEKHLERPVKTHYPGAGRRRMATAAFGEDRKAARRRRSIQDRPYPGGDFRPREADSGPAGRGNGIGVWRG